MLRQNMGVFLSDFDKEFTGAHEYTDHQYLDVSIDCSGLLVVGGTGDYVFAINATTVEPLWYCNGAHPYVSRFVRVSEDGSAVVTAGPGPDSLHYFSITAVVTFDQLGVGQLHIGQVYILWEDWDNAL